MTFDPFGDFATEGYLRNFEKEKDLALRKLAGGRRAEGRISESVIRRSSATKSFGQSMAWPRHAIETRHERRVLRPLDDREVFLFLKIAQIAFGREIAERIEGHGLASRRYFT